MKKTKQANVAPAVGAEASSPETAAVDPAKVQAAKERLAIALSALIGEGEVKENVLPPVAPVLTGRQYDSVADMMKGEGFPQSIQDKVTELTKNDPPETPASLVDVSDTAGVIPGHKCAVEDCPTMLSEGGTLLCPAHQQLQEDAKALLAATADVADVEPAQPPPPPPPEQTGKRFFKKLFATTPLFAGGQRVKVEVLGSNVGVIATTDAGLIEALDGLIAMNKSGVIAIDEATYEGLKKNLPFVPSPKPPLQKLSIVNPLIPKRKPLPQGRSQNPAGARAAAVDDSVGARVGSDGGGEAGGSGALSPASSLNKGNGPVGFTPATAPKQFKMPVTKQTTSRSLSGGTPIGDLVRLPD